MPTEEERQEEYLFAIAALLLMYENRARARVDLVLRQQLKEARQLVEQMSADGVFRQYEWNQLSRQAPAVFEPIADELKEALGTVLPEVEEETMKRAALYIDKEPPDIPTSDTDTLLRAVVMGSTAASLGALLARPGGAHSRFARNLANQLDKTVKGGLLREASTADIAQNVAPQTTRNGQSVTAIRGGTFANGARQRVRNSVRGAVWATSGDAEGKVWTPYRNLEYKWLATLENTCPICMGLHGQIKPRRSDFPYWPGHVHYNCRCKVVPLTKANTPA